jgi:uncharacterized protein YjiS (DUF1127 family)
MSSVSRHARQNQTSRESELAEMTVNTYSNAPLRSPVAILKRRWTTYLHWRAQHAAIRQLSAMNDRGLKDIGLIRSEIERAVRGDEPFRRRA